MSHFHDDPRLTAYALGEMNESERAAFEAAIAGDERAQEAIEAIRALGRRLEDTLPDLETPRLDADQRNDLARAAAPGRSWTFAVAIAALLVVGLGVGLAVTGPNAFRSAGDDDGARETALMPYAHEQGVRARDALVVEKPEPVVKDAEVWDHVETDGDLPFLESETAEAPGASPVALTPPPASGPSIGLVGLGGGAGGPVGGLLPAEPADGAVVADAGRKAILRLEALEEASREREALGFTGPQSGDAQGPSTEGYDTIVENPFYRVTDKDTSTFSVDVDTASYANVRRFLNQGVRPPPGAVRIEELVNYFPYDYAPPPADAEHPFAWRAAVAACPWAPDHRLVRVALKGKVLDQQARPPANLVFLLDVSGSMRPANKLGLVKEAMKLLVAQLEERDQISIVVYAGAAGLVLPPTSGDQKDVILGALDRLHAGGSTNGGQGIQLAYDTAVASFVEGGANRVILCTDGDFNVGTSDRSSLNRMIEEKAKSGVFLTLAGFGMGNLKDDLMEDLSNRGNGNYAYVDSLREAKKVFVEDGLGTLVTIAKDVKVQVFFNPKTVAGWRLIGYENRVLRRQDFNDDTKDAGEIGAGHTVTALYEIVPAGKNVPAPRVDGNPFVAEGTDADADETTLLRLRLRYKLPDADTSTLLETDVQDEGKAFEFGDRDLQWSAAVAGFGMLLRDSPHRGLATWPLIEEIARAAKGDDPRGHRAEFLALIPRAAAVAPVAQAAPAAPAVTPGGSPAAPTTPSAEKGGPSGEVLAAEGSLVVISLGTEDGVAPGDVFVVTREGAIVGLLRVTDVEAQKAAGRVTSTSTTAEAFARPGDRVQAR